MAGWRVNEIVKTSIRAQTIQTHLGQLIDRQLHGSSSWGNTGSHWAKLSINVKVFMLYPNLSYLLFCLYKWLCNYLLELSINWTFMFLIKWNFNISFIMLALPLLRINYPQPKTRCWSIYGLKLKIGSWWTIHFMLHFSNVMAQLAGKKGRYAILETTIKKVRHTDVYITQNDVHICQSVTNSCMHMHCAAPATPSMSGSMSIVMRVTILQADRWLVSLTRSALSRAGSSRGWWRHSQMQLEHLCGTMFHRERSWDKS